VVLVDEKETMSIMKRMENGELQDQVCPSCGEQMFGQWFGKDVQCIDCGQTYPNLYFKE